MTEDIKNSYNMQCPSCGMTAEIDVAATVWVRLCEDGTDIYESHNGDQEWTDNSAAHCASCGHTGTVASFTVT